MASCRWTKCFNCKRIMGVGRYHVVLNGKECIKLLCSDCVKALGAYRKGQASTVNSSLSSKNPVGIQVYDDDQSQWKPNKRGTSLQDRLNSLLL